MVCLRPRHSVGHSGHAELLEEFFHRRAGRERIAVVALGLAHAVGVAGIDDLDADGNHRRLDLRHQIGKSRRRRFNGGMRGRHQGRQAEQTVGRGPEGKRGDAEAGDRGEQHQAPRRKQLWLGRIGFGGIVGVRRGHGVVSLVNREGARSQPVTYGDNAWAPYQDLSRRFNIGNDRAKARKIAPDGDEIAIMTKSSCAEPGNGR